MWFFSSREWFALKFWKNTIPSKGTKSILAGNKLSSTHKSLAWSHRKSFFALNSIRTDKNIKITTWSQSWSKIREKIREKSPSKVTQCNIESQLIRTKTANIQKSQSFCYQSMPMKVNPCITIDATWYRCLNSNSQWQQQQPKAASHLKCSKWFLSISAYKFIAAEIKFIDVIFPRDKKRDAKMT